MIFDMGAIASYIYLASIVANALRLVLEIVKSLNIKVITTKFNLNISSKVTGYLI